MGLVPPRNTRQTPDLVRADNLVLVEQIEKLPVRITKSTPEPVGSTSVEWDQLNMPVVELDS